MRVAILKGDYDAAGGPETLLAALVPCLPRNGVEPVVIVLEREHGSDLLAVTALSHNLERHVVAWPGLGGAVAAAGRLADLLEVTGVAIVHSNDMRCNLAMALSRSARRRPWLAHVHGWLGHTHRFRYRVYEAIDRRAVCLADLVVVGSSTAQVAVAKAGARAVVVVPNAISLPSQYPSGGDGRSPDPASRTSLRTRLGVAPGTTLVGIVGRVHPGKGQDLVIEAMDLLLRRGRSVHLIIVGDGPARSDIEAAIARRGLARSVTLTGYVGDLEPYWRAIDIAVVASRQESLPLTALEAMVRGKPLVAAAVGDLPTVIEHGRYGLLFSPGDAGALAAAIARLLDEPALRQELTVSGPRRVAERYLVDGMARQLTAIYSRLLVEGRRS